MAAVVGWTPGDYIEAGKLALQGLEFVATVAVFVFMLFMKRDLDGRFSQLIDLVGRFSGVPNRRHREEPVDVERRAGKS